MESERLYFRKITRNDRSDLCKILQDEKAMYAYEGKFSDEEVDGWIDRQLWRYENENGLGLYAVMLKENNTLKAQLKQSAEAAKQFRDSAVIGQCGITLQDYNGKKVPEIGYLFQRSFWHMGYATEAAAFWKKYAFDALGFETVYSIIRDTNLPSQRVAERNGMIKTDVFVKHYRGVDMPHFVYVCNKESLLPK